MSEVDRYDWEVPTPWRTHVQKSNTKATVQFMLVNTLSPRSLLHAIFQFKCYSFFRCENVLIQPRQLRSHLSTYSQFLSSFINLQNLFSKSQQCEDCGVSSRMSLLHDMGSHPKAHAQSSRMLCSSPASSWLSSSSSRYP